MAKVLIDVKDDFDIRKLKKNDVLMYDNTSGQFYKVSADVFFDKYEKKLNALLLRYDKEFEKMRQENKNLRTNYNNFAAQIKNSNIKLIEMVESFIESKE